MRSGRRLSKHEEARLFRMRGRRSPDALHSSTSSTGDYTTGEATPKATPPARVCLPLNRFWRFEQSVKTKARFVPDDVVRESLRTVLETVEPNRLRKLPVDKCL